MKNFMKKKLLVSTSILLVLLTSAFIFLLWANNNDAAQDATEDPTSNEGAIERLNEKLSEWVEEEDEMDNQNETGEKFGSGTFLVNDDIEPGLYSASPVESCVWFRLSGLDEGETIDSGGYDAGSSAYIEIMESDYAVRTSGCGTWVKQ